MKFNLWITCVSVLCMFNNVLFPYYSVKCINFNPFIELLLITNDFICCCLFLITTKIFYGNQIQYAVKFN